MALPAWQPGEALGAKLVTVFPDNPSAPEPLPSVQALFVLFDGIDGRPLAVIDGTEMTYRKTACDSALGAQLLARPDVQTLLMVGCGALAPHLVEAHCAVRPSITKVLLWNRSSPRAEAVAVSLASTVDASIEVVSDLDSILPLADLVCTATMAKDPLVRGSLVRPGAHLDLVGAFRPDHREVDTDAVVRAEVFVDSRLAAVEESGDLVIPLAERRITSDHIRGDLYQLCRGEVAARSAPDAITLFENGGGGHLDLMTAWFAWKQWQSM